MTTRSKGNVVDLIAEPLGGAVISNATLTILGGITVPDGAGVNLPALIISGNHSYLFPIGREFTVVGGPNAGVYTVVSPGAKYFKGFPASALPLHINDTTEIPTSPTPSSAGSFGDIQPFGIDMGSNRIINVPDPVLDQDCATKNYVDNEILGSILPILNSLIVAGSIVAWTSNVIPENWLLCDGSSYDSDADPSLATLFANIGTSYGGTGSDNFNIPDLRGRFLVGLNSIPIFSVDRLDRVEVRTLGGVNGSEFHQLIDGEMPKHTHNGITSDGGVHSHSGNAGNDGGHEHNVKARDIPDVDTDDLTIDYFLLHPDYSLKSNFLDGVGDHTHAITNMSMSGKHDHLMLINSNGSGFTHENTPPYQVVNYIIKR